MPNIKAAEKWVRQSEKRAARNRGVRSRLRTLAKRAAGGGSEANQAAESAFDKAAQKGIIHPNKAARKKSRLARAQRLNASAAASTPAKAATKKRAMSKRPPPAARA